MPEHGDDRLDERVLKLLPAWDKVVKAMPLDISNITSPFEGEELTQL